jgi:SAM-dependent methyltransferase
MFSRFKTRSLELENIDTGSYSADEYEACLVELRWVNRWLGDVRALSNSLLKELARSGLKRFSVLDVGAGSGELLRVVSKWAGENNKEAQLVGLELNARSARAIREESAGSISSVNADALAEPFVSEAFDYSMCSLFTHHLTDDQVVRLFQELSRVTKSRIVVIDLHRHAVAYFLYTTVLRLFLHTRLLREDGALSILRSFRKDELQHLAERAGLRDIRVTRRFPFRLVLSAGRGLSCSLEQTEEHQLRLAS